MHQLHKVTEALEGPSQATSDLTSICINYTKWQRLSRDRLKQRQIWHLYASITQSDSGTWGTISSNVRL